MSVSKNQYSTDADTEENKEEWMTSPTAMARLTTDLSGNTTGVGSGSLLSQPYKFMFESLRERAAVLDEAICRAADLLTARLHLAADDLMDTRTTTVEPQIAVGRICCDSEGHINSNSVLLQGSMDMCGGHTLPLDLSQLETYALFPGQIVGVECTNPNGSKLLVTKLYANEPIEPAPTINVDDEQSNRSESGQVTQLLVSAGPYTTTNSDDWQPLLDILDCVKKSEPQVLVLIGPFVDVKNTTVEQSSLSYQQIFDNMLKDVYIAVQDGPTQVILVPSQRNAHEDFVYPQPPFNIGSSDRWNNKIR